MGRLNVNPTRMELSKLKKRLVVASRGHKLLKDKQDELMRQFITLVKYNNELRKKVEEKLSESFKDFVMAKAILGSEFLEEAIFYPTNKISLDVLKFQFLNLEEFLRMLIIFLMDSLTQMLSLMGQL
mgnify:CR=1 FL=1